ncbi:MAG TPA: DDE-type integrase/transposase/recombinase [Acidobacteriota bacterium]|jgi:transposase InsO family protein
MMQKKENKKSRGLKNQQMRRHLERQVRRDVLVFARWLLCHRINIATAAEKLGLSLRTLLCWQLRWKTDRLAGPSRGRPQQRADRQLRNAIIALFQLTGPGIGLPALQEIFPDVARRELESLLYRYRNVYRKRNQLLVYALRWLKTGSVWALDFTEPPLPVDGIYKQILVVRDLASGMQLAALPAPDGTAQVAHDLLLALFREHGSPLLVKSDNGSPFICAQFAQLLQRFQVLHLLSPPGLPQYNGACEAGIGSIKTRAHHQSARHDRPGQWTCDDVESARLMANETARPAGLYSPTPSQQWRMHPTMAQVERLRFIHTVNDYRTEVRKELGYLPEIELAPKDAAHVDRVAITRALIALGLLALRRRRITLHVNRSFYARIK